MASEFELIGRYFQSLAQGDGVVLGVGDDTAVLTPSPDHELLATVDTMVAGVHFLSDMPAEDLGFKAMAVNLSDIAAMGGRPRWATLALTLPERDEPWLEAFAQGLGEACRGFEVGLIGGDTTRGPLTITIQLLGEVLPGSALRRDGARVGDALFVTGTLGDAGLGLACLQGRVTLSSEAKAQTAMRLQRPEPRVTVGRALLGLASAAIDVSDGLLADFAHIGERSRVGGEIHLERLPLSPAVRNALVNGLVDWDLPLTAGDDYELLFTAPPANAPTIDALASRLGCRITRIGTVTEGDELHVLDERGQEWRPAMRGYDHFGGDDT